MVKWTFPEKSIKSMDAEIKTKLATEVKISIIPMKLSGNRIEHYVRISRDNVTYETRRYIEAHYNRALYERDMLNYVINGGPKPDLMDDQYADLPAQENPQRLS